MSDSADIGAVPASVEGERHERGRFGDLGDRLARVFPRQRQPEEESTVAVLEETVEFTPPDVEAAPAWSGPRFPRAWPGYHRPAVDQYVGELELELEALRAERVPDARAREEIASVGDETSAILVVAHDKAHALVARAQEQADALIAEAHNTAKAVTEDTERRLSELDGDTDAVWRERTRMIEDTRKLADRLLSVADDAADRFPAEAEEKAGSAAPAPDPAPSQLPEQAAVELGPPAPPWQPQI
jgi:cell division septum initiation protein DivIVA